MRNLRAGSIRAAGCGTHYPPRRGSS